MNHLQLLAGALDYIEEHLLEELCTEDVANVSFCSKSSLEKLFRRINHISVHEYIVRRRIVYAAKVIRDDPQVRLLDVAVMIGYSSNEAFSRAFRKVWNCNPSEFASKYNFSDLFPKYISPENEGDDIMNASKKVDISELYDLFRSRKKCYFILGDIKHMVEINKVSRNLGDLAILETMKRMSEAGGSEDVIFRIGGDEFALLTNCEQEDQVKDIVENIAKKNEGKVACDGAEWELSLHLSYLRLDDDKSRVQYDELFDTLHQAIVDNK